jgi:outer membrane biosynthesis protein TonB
VTLLAIRNFNRPPEELVERFVQAEFTVTAQGGVKEIRVAEQDATPRQIAETLDAVRASRYRPKFVNGEPVETTAVIYRQVFKQRKEAE